jgi:ABC-type phosphate/phosphonate transport system substrate-binding protein
LFSEQSVVPLASVRKVPYQSAIIVAIDSRLQRPADLVGKRAAWVDQHSAAGFVIPRIKLSRLGIDPRTAFGNERFFQSHEDVVAAVAEKQVDFGATWAHAEGQLTRGPWTKSPYNVRVVATFGSIPPDVIAARIDLDQPTRKLLVNALKSIYSDRQSRWLVSHALGTEAFYRPDLGLYGRLQESVAEAYRSGLLNLGATPARDLEVQQSLEARPRMPSRYEIPDPTEAETKSNPQWSLEEIEDEEIEILEDDTTTLLK